MSTLQLENIRHPDATDNALELAADGSVSVVNGFSGNVGIGTSTPTVDGTGTAPGWMLPVTQIKGPRPTLYLNGDGTLVTMRLWPNGDDGTSTTLDDWHINVRKNSSGGDFGIAHQGGAYGAALQITNTGYVKAPINPSFYVKDLNYSTTGGSYGTGGVVLHNNGNHYNTSNGRFTAPVSGTYAFYGSIQQFQSGSGDYVGLTYDKNGVQYGIEFVSGIVTNNGHYNDHHTQEGFIVIAMNSGDYINIEANRGARDAVQNAFGGYLIG